MARVLLSRNIRFVEAMAFLSLLICGLTSVALQPFDAGLLWILAAVFAVFHDGWFAFTFRHDLVGTGDEPRPVLRLSDDPLTDRELQVLHLVWGGRAA